MTFNWSEYLEFAKKQACVDQNGNIDETTCRASISRAYYAAFCSSRNYLCSNGDNSLRFAYHGDPFARETVGSVHEYVIDQFALESEVPEKVIISETLKTLKARRVFADYKNHHDSKIDIKVLESLEHAKHIIDDLKKL